MSEATEKRNGDVAVSPVAILVPLVARRRLVFAVAAAITLGAVAWRLTFAPVVAVARFVPETSAAQSARTAFGAIGGLLGASSSESQDFYLKLFESRELRGSVVRAKYTRPDGAAVSYWEAFDIADSIGVKGYNAAIGDLSDRLSIRGDAMSGVIVLQLRAREGWLAEAVAQSLVDALNAFNVERRQSRARNERSFTEQRLLTATNELSLAERQLEAFLLENRGYGSSPTLVVQFERLQREREVKRATLLTLTQAFEQARIDEVRETPVITVIDSPAGSARYPLPLPLFVALSGVVGVLIGAIVALGGAYVAYDRRVHAAVHAELREALRGGRDSDV